MQFPHYWRLMRFDRPVGTLLLLWPTLWGLWLATEGLPDFKLLVIFCLGVVVMRAAGCVINDYADRDLDGRVQRTKGRPLATGMVSKREALYLFALLLLIAFALVLMTNALTILLSFGAVALASLYPFMKRYTHMPQMVLGAAFSWGIPMAFAAQTESVPSEVWLIYLAAIIWTVVYDTFYAMVDREDDLQIGIKSTAILFGEADRMMTGIMQVMVIFALYLAGQNFNMQWPYWIALVISAGLFGYQQYLIRDRQRAECFKAFMNNNWVGCAIFIGIASDFAIRAQ